MNPVLQLRAPFSDFGRGEIRNMAAAGYTAKQIRARFSDSINISTIRRVIAKESGLRPGFERRPSHD